MEVGERNVHRHCVRMRHVQPRGVRVTMIDDDVVLVDALVRHCNQLDRPLAIDRVDPGDPQLRRRVAAFQADVVTVDPAEIADPIGLFTVVLSASPRSRLMVLSRSGDTMLAVTLAKAGAVGWVSKEEPVTAFVDAVHALCRGEARFPPQHLGAVLRAVLSRTTAMAGENRCDGRELSARERQILAQVLAGATSRDIARDLNLSASTIRSHRRRMAVKLGL